MKLFFSLIIVVMSGLAAGQETIRTIDSLVETMDQMSANGDFRETSFREKSIEAIVRIYPLKDHLLKVRVQYERPDKMTQKEFYMMRGKLVFLRELIHDQPEPPIWEEAKSNELGQQAIERTLEPRKAVFISYFIAEKVVQTTAEEIPNYSDLMTELRQLRELIN